jgi:hypothetical protein
VVSHRQRSFCASDCIAKKKKKAPSDGNRHGKTKSKGRIVHNESGPVCSRGDECQWMVPEPGKLKASRHRAIKRLHPWRSSFTFLNKTGRQMTRYRGIEASINRAFAHTGTKLLAPRPRQIFAPLTFGDSSFILPFPNLPLCAADQDLVDRNMN